MDLLLKRDMAGATCTHGSIYESGEFICYTLEDPQRPEKTYGDTAIPAGRYEVVITHSPRFGVQMPLLLNVPGYSGIRIHPGNTNADTLGCILPGFIRADESVGQSRAAYRKLFAMIQEALDDGEKVWITVEALP